MCTRRDTGEGAKCYMHTCTCACACCIIRMSIRLCALVPSLSVRVRPIRSFTDYAPTRHAHGASNLLEPRHSWWLEPVNMLLTRMRWEVTLTGCYSFCR